MSESTILTSIISRMEAGQSLIEFLCRRFRYHTREAWVELIREGLVKVNGVQACPGLILIQNDAVSYEKKGSEPPVNSCFRIIHEEETFLVAFKPGNLPSHSDGNYIKHTFIYLLKEHQKKKGYEGFLSLAHRLDRETSGLIVATKDKQAHRNFAQQFEQGKVEKVYLAVARGIILEDMFEVSGVIIPDPESAIAIKKIVLPWLVNSSGIRAGDAGAEPVVRDKEVNAGEGGKKEGRASYTRFEVIERLKDATLIRCMPQTGRTNQIRVHLAHTGHPIAGDKIYGRTDSQFLEYVSGAKRGYYEKMPWLETERHMLHAFRLGFSHPVTGVWTVFESPIPSDMLSFIESARTI